MNISGSIALVSGANRGLGRAYARELNRSPGRDHELIYPPIQEFWDAAVSGTS